MRRVYGSRLTAAVLTSLATLSPAWGADVLPDKYKEWTSEREIFVPMRDGVHLSTDVMLPKGVTGRLSTILVRTPYDKNHSELSVLLKWHEFFLKHGYAFVLQSERGKYLSEGYYNNVLQGASADGYDTISWIVQQPWSNGKVGTIGCSAPGMQQWPMAASNHPAHLAMIPINPVFAVGNIPGNETRGAFYRGGVPLLGAWAEWNNSQNLSERPAPPPNSTQEQRIRLEKGYSFSPRLFSAGAEISIGMTGFMHLPSMDVLRALGGPLTPFDRYIKWTPGDSRWSEVEFIGAEAKPRVPALHLNTWFDLGVGENTRLFKYLQDLGTPGQYLIVGPGGHCAPYWDQLSSEVADATELSHKLTGTDSGSVSKLSDLKVADVEFGDARYRGEELGYAKLFLNWFEYWLNDVQNHVTEMPKVQLFIMGKGWVSDDRWPPRGTRFVNYYISGGHSSGHQLEAGWLSPSRPRSNADDSYVYDPGLPAPSHGDDCCDFVGFDQRLVEMRKDVLSYSTHSLDSSVTIAGPIEVVLYVSSSAPDTDLIVRLVDVYPDGKAISLSDDAFRVRYRDGFDKQVLMHPSTVYKITLSNMVTAIRFAKGHRIRLEISSSSFPEFERNLNTGRNNYDEAAWVVAVNTIHSGPKYPSRIVLPVQPE